MSSGFISETEIVNQRQKRQEEWEKVRTADQPVEAPEEEYDPRSLFDRLQEQKQKKDYEYEEAHKLKNMIKGLDDEEVQFLDLVDKSKYEEEKRKYEEEKEELNEFRMKRACLEEESVEQRIQNEIKCNKHLVSQTNSNKISSQSKLLAGALVKKSNNNIQESKNTNIKRKHCDDEESCTTKLVKSEELVSSSECQPMIECIGILPGIGSYGCSSDSNDSSSDCETTEPQLDLLGRKIIKKKQESNDSD